MAAVGVRRRSKETARLAAPMVFDADLFLAAEPLGASPADRCLLADRGGALRKGGTQRTEP